MTATTGNVTYCVKCRAKKEVANPQPVTMRNGRPALQGTCPTCGIKLVRLLPKDRDERIPACFADRPCQWGRQRSSERKARGPSLMGGETHATRPGPPRAPQRSRPPAQAAVSAPTLTWSYGGVSREAQAFRCAVASLLLAAVWLATRAGRWHPHEPCSVSPADPERRVA
ncbi:MAG: DUF5679 domain-containing protein [Ktedonobacteraceae bacterium]